MARRQAFAYVQIHLSSTTRRDDGLGPGPVRQRRRHLLPGGSRNLAVRCADADVVILHDADMVLPAAAYLEAAELALSSDRLVIGFNRYRPLSKARTVEAFGGADPFASSPSTSSSTSRSAGARHHAGVLVGGWRHGRAVRRLGL